MIKSKCTIIGDSGVGKTSLIMAYSTHHICEDYAWLSTATGLKYTTTSVIDEKQVTMVIKDSAGQAEYDRLRPLAYPNTDVFLICFSLINHETLKKVRDKWYPEVLQHCPNAATILVGTKLDLREPKLMTTELVQNYNVIVSHEQGVSMAKEIGSLQYLECSALTEVGVNEVFVKAMSATIPSTETSFTKRKLPKSCITL